MRRHLRSIAAAMSLLLCLVIFLAALRSYWDVSGVRRSARAHDGAAMQTDQVEFYDGRFIFVHDIWERGGDAACNYDLYSYPAREHDDDWDMKNRILGFGWQSEKDTGMQHSTLQILSIPSWTLLAGSCALLFIFARKPRRPNPHGTCPRCGYNLTGNTRGVCPECGTSLAESIPAHSHGR